MVDHGTYRKRGREMRRYVTRSINVIQAIVVVGVVVILAACGEGTNPTEQSLARTATAFSVLVARGPGAASAASATTNRTGAQATPRAPASVIVASTPTPLTVAVATIRSGSPGTQTTPIPTRVPAASVATAQPIPPVMQAVTVMADGDANMRSQPATDASIVSRIPAGTEVIVLQTNVIALDGGMPWVKVTFKGQTGYVRNDLVGPLHSPGVNTIATENAASNRAAVTATPA